MVLDGRNNGEVETALSLSRNDKYLPFFRLQFKKNYPKDDHIFVTVRKASLNQ